MQAINEPDIALTFTGAGEERPDRGGELSPPAAAGDALAAISTLPSGEVCK